MCVRQKTTELRFFSYFSKTTKTFLRKRLSKFRCSSRLRLPPDLLHVLFPNTPTYDIQAHKKGNNCKSCTGVIIEYSTYNYYPSLRPCCGQCLDMEIRLAAPCTSPMCMFFSSHMLTFILSIR